MTKQVAKTKKTAHRRKYSWPYVACFLSVACALFFMVASVTDLRELRCLHDEAAPTLTCQLTYRSLMVEEVKTVQGVQSVDFISERRFTWLLGETELRPRGKFVTLTTANGPHTFKVYTYPTSTATTQEIEQFSDRVLVLHNSPSEGLSMPFASGIGHIMSEFFGLVTLLLMGLFSVILLAILLALFCSVEIEGFFPNRLKRSIALYSQRYWLLGGAIAFSAYVFWLGMSLPVLLSGVAICLFCGSFIWIIIALLRSNPVLEASLRPNFLDSETCARSNQ